MLYDHCLAKSLARDSPKSLKSVLIGEGSVNANIVGITNVTKQGTGLTHIQIASSYSGVTEINGGILRLSHPGGLGQSSGTPIDATIIGTDGTLQIDKNLTLNNELLILSGGTIRDSNQGDGGSITINNPIQLAQNTTSTIVGGPTETTRVNGIISGDGNIEVLGSGLGSRVVEFHGANNYVGETIAGYRSNLIVYDSQGLGTTDGGSTIGFGGQIALRATSSEPITLDGGQLVLQPVGVHMNPILARSGRFRAVDSVFAGDPPIIHNGDIVLDGFITFFANEPLSLGGNVSGQGELIVSEFSNSSINFAGETTHFGDVIVHGSFILDGAFRHQGNYIQESGSFTANGPMDMDGIAIFTAGVARINADSSLNGMVLSADPTENIRFFQGVPQLIIAPGVTLSTGSDDIEALGGEIQGQIDGITAITKRSHLTLALNGLGGDFDGPIEVHRGIIEAHGATGLGSDLGGLSLHDPRNSKLHMIDGGDVFEDIALNNATGFQLTGALEGSNTTFHGQIDLGNDGAFIAQADIAGTITGGDLNVIDDVTLRGAGHTFSGHTIVRGSQLLLTDSAMLSSTTGINLHAATQNGSDTGRLILDNRGTANLGDRVGDGVPVVMSSGQIELRGRNAAASSETLGVVTLAGGENFIQSYQGTGGGSQATLTIGQLNRNPDATVRFETGGNASKIFITNAPSLAHGIIGGWAVQGDEFASYNANGVVPYSQVGTYVTDIIGASATDNVKQQLINGGFLLPGDVTINSLINTNGGGNNAIDLNGHTLNIVTEGLINPDIGGNNSRIINGILTAGGSGPGELTIHALDSLTQIQANIVDNGVHAVGLTTGGKGSIDLEGINTYSGPTIINDSHVRVITDQSLPHGTNLVLNRSELEFSYQSNDAFQFGDVHILNGGSIFWTSNGPPIDAVSWNVESGRMDVSLAGTGDFTKDSPGIFRLDRESPNYFGKIIIEQGTLSVTFGDALGGGPQDDDHATYVKYGGILALNRDSEELVILQGGRVVGRDFFGTLDVREPSIVGGQSESFELFGSIVGDADLTVDGPFDSRFLLIRSDLSDFKGDLILEGGRVHLVNAQPLYSGDIFVRGTSADLSTNTGTGTVHLDPGGLLVVADSLDANVMLRGGTLRTLDGSTLDGMWTVAADTEIRTRPIFGTDDPADNRFISTVLMEDGVRLTKSGLGNLTFDGILLLQGNSEIRSTGGQILFGGLISPDSGYATLDIIHANLTEFGSSLHVDNGESLAILFDGVAEEITLGPGQTLSGNGTFGNPFSLGDGGSVAPGGSVGLLIGGDDATFEGGGIYEFEIQQAHGTLGSGYDSLIVGGTLKFTSDPSDPFIIELIGLDENGDRGLVADFDPNGIYAWDIVIASAITDFDPAAILIDAEEFLALHGPLPDDRYFEVLQLGGTLRLNYIPEPASLLLIAMSGFMLMKRQRYAA